MGRSPSCRAISPSPQLSAAARAASCLVLFALAGCEVGADYKAPAADLHPFHNAVAAGARAQQARTPPLDRWWLGFDDPVLVEIVDRVLAQNLGLSASIARVQQARAAASASRAALLPTVDAAGQVTPIHQSLFGPIGSIGRHLPGYSRGEVDYNTGIGASWEIDLFGGLRRQERAAIAEAEAAEAQRLGTRITVAADAADAYFQIRGYQARLRVAEQQIDVDGGLLRLVRLRRTQAIATDRGVAQAEALLQQGRVAVPDLKAGLEAQLNRLDVLMGVQPGTYAAKLSPPAEIDAAPGVPATEAPGDVLRRRPDVIAAERKLAAADARIGAAVSDYYTKLSLSALLGFESLDAGRLFTAAAFQPEGVGALRWRLFDFGKVDAEVAQARGSRAEALASYRQAVLRAAEDVEDALSAQVQTENRTGELEREVASSLERARALSQQAYEAGVNSLTDVLDADRQLLAARDSLALSKADAARAAVASFRAFGGGWTT